MHMGYCCKIACNMQKKWLGHARSTDCAVQSSCSSTALCDRSIAKVLWSRATCMLLTSINNWVNFTILVDSVTVRWFSRLSSCMCVLLIWWNNRCCCDRIKKSKFSINGSDGFCKLSTHIYIHMHKKPKIWNLACCAWSRFENILTIYSTYRRCRLRITHVNYNFLFDLWNLKFRWSRS